ncbi:MAG: purine-nucleoside phosphorylase [Deltaproteobacteria bacterium]|jgi:purine-nucleoside phosphorylase|nr:purine-nucleoside phosphorylase [Deltaproteobacteria bacterium]
MELFCKQVEEAAAFIGTHLDIRPKIGLILGTGLGGIVDAMDKSAVFPYGEIPHYPVSTVTSHEGRLICGSWAGKPILVMQGRFHLYEGYTARQISFPIRVMQTLGMDTLILSNAAGGLNPQFSAGDLMLITDHINLTGHNPLAGPNVDRWGDRFPDMTEPYCRRLQALALRTALAERILLHRGVYVGVLGPSLETAAETRFLRAMGADAVGMSTIMEVITAVHAGLKVLGISVITNVNLPDAYQPAPLEKIIATAEQAGSKLVQLLAKVLEQL